MTSSGSGDRSPAPPRAVMDDLLDLHGRAAMLQTMLEGSPTPPRAVERELVEGMMSSLTSALSALNTSGGARGGVSSSAGGRGSGGRRKKGAAVAGPHRRSSSSSFCRRRTLSPFLETVATNTLDDGHAWRKYGQKSIQDSENPRSYYRCTHMPDQGCKARKQVQVSDTNPSEYIVNYFGQHTCRDLSTVPLVIEAATDAPTNCANFISFGGSTTTCAAHPVPPHLQAVAPTMILSRFAGYSFSLPAAHERCGSEEAISGISPLGAVVAGSKGRTSSTTVGSAPEYDMLAGGIDTGSFPSSPSSLGGFMTGSFGSFGDDDLFDFDP